MNKPSITAIEIESKEFSTSLRGYQTAEVRAFLSLLAEEFAALSRENRNLQESLASAERERARLSSQEDTVKEALLFAQKAADDLRDSARAEARLVLREAELERASAVAEIERLHAEKAAFAAQLRHMLDAFYERLSEEPAPLSSAR